MDYWKCIICGFIYRHIKSPEMCLVCNSGKEKLKKIDSSKFLKIEDFENPIIKKSYKTA